MAMGELQQPMNGETKEEEEKRDAPFKPHTWPKQNWVSPKKNIQENQMGENPKLNRDLPFENQKILKEKAPNFSEKQNDQNSP